MYITFGSPGSNAIVETPSTGWPVGIRSQASTPTPPDVLRQRPPLAAPAQTVVGVTGSKARVSMRPPPFVGPRGFHRSRGVFFSTSGSTPPGRSSSASIREADRSVRLANAWARA